MEENQEKSNDFTYYYGSINVLLVYFHKAFAKYENAGIHALGSFLVRINFSWIGVFMDCLNECILNLIDAIKAHEDYIKYIRCKKELEKYPEIMLQINEFRLKNYQLQNSDEEKDFFVENDVLTDELEKMSKNPLVSDFLDGELSICKMVQRVNYEMANGIELDIMDFLGEITLV